MPPNADSQTRDVRSEWIRKISLFLKIFLGVLVLLILAVWLIGMSPMSRMLGLGNSSDMIQTHGGGFISEFIYKENQRALESIRQFTAHGEYNEASDAAVSILNAQEKEETLTSRQLDTARRGLFSKYRATGNPADSLAVVAELKKTALDEKMPIERRADAITSLANSLCWFARSEDVVSAIFDTAPFSNYWHGDPTLANRDLLLYSYKNYVPTPKTSAALAYWYADQVILDKLVAKKLDSKTYDAYLKEAKRYITESKSLSDSALAAGAQGNNSYAKSARYIGYLYRRAFAIGALASIGELPKSDYEAAYKLFYDKAALRETPEALQYTPFAHVLQARFEKNMGASDEVVNAHLKAALETIDSDPNPQSNEIVDFIRDKALDAEGRYSWHAIQQMRSQLPEFDAFVEDVEAARQTS